MEIKPLNLPIELRLFRLLHSRMSFSNEVMKHYQNLEKGFTGEKLMSDYLKLLTSEMHILHNLEFEINNTKFQIDHLLISKHSIIFIEVKYYGGDYEVKGHDWICRWNGEKITNPLRQVERTEILLGKLLQSIGFKLNIEPYLVFNHPEFWLYNAPQDPSIIYPTQMKRFIGNLDRKNGSLNQSHLALAKKLMEVAKDESPYKNLPAYSFIELQKGVQCPKCRSFMSFKNRITLGCTKQEDTCDYTETVESGTLRCVEEVRLLFPEMKITVKDIYEWCGREISDRTIERILTKHYKVVFHGPYSYYIVD
ncbi:MULTISPECIES: nuclease-related domain-containing protein [Bacillaceae]|uniref:NERD domain-containing protein n=1 Tax=Evansella alkalicola TaxID=745819 RepID=A0ABS6JWQ2_9BACI|nr:MULTISPECIES: nuclease-related domain-containing protein [Bacillaceae]MBU9722506.1 NERD domain-containing protein [Bacillus alkalicola]